MLRGWAANRKIKSKLKVKTSWLGTKVRSIFQWVAIERDVVLYLTENSEIYAYILKGDMSTCLSVQIVWEYGI